MMDMKISGGFFKITDDNRTTVSKDIADEIMESYISPDDFKDSDHKPEFDIAK